MFDVNLMNYIYNKLLGNGLEYSYLYIINGTEKVNYYLDSNNIDTDEYSEYFNALETDGQYREAIKKVGLYFANIFVHCMKYYKLIK